MSTTAGPMVPAFTGISTVLSPTLMVAVVWVIEHLPSAEPLSSRSKFRTAAQRREQVKPKGAALSRRRLFRVLVAESLGILVVGEQLAISAEIDHSAQGRVGVILRHIVLELFAEAARRRPV